MEIMASRPERPTNLAVVESCTLLNSIPVADRQQVANNSFMAYAERGEVIWLAGTAAECCVIAGTGFIKMTKLSSSGHEVTMELLGPGQVLGLMAVIEGRQFPLSAVSVTNCWYLKVPARVILPIYQANSNLKDQVVRTIGPRVRRAHEMMSRFSTGSAEECIAAVLFILADSYGTHKGNKIRLDVPLTRQEISEMAGTTVETTIRVMSRWQKSGIVRTEHQMITILDAERLDRIMRDAP